MLNTQPVRISAFLAVLVTALQACAESVPAPPSGGRFVPFEQFIAGIAAARFEDYRQDPERRVGDAAAFEAMRRHVLYMYEGVEVRHSFVLHHQHVDCVPFEQQPGARLLPPGELVREPPGPPPLPPLSAGGRPPRAGTPAPPMLDLRRKDPFGNELGCRRGVPMRRITLEELTRFRSLREFFQKGRGGGRQLRPLDQPPGDAPDLHRYAVGFQTVENFGGSSWLNLWSPPVDSGAGEVFSLSQQWYAGGEGKNLQTVEGGWQVSPQRYDTSDAALFIYYTPDGYQNGCHNLDCPAFVQIDSTNWVLGGTWGDYSETGGTQVEFFMYWWRPPTGDWWLLLRETDGDLDGLGYYPDSVYKGGQLANFATFIEYGGETTATASAGPWAPMGSGEFADEDFEEAAYQRTIFFVASRTGMVKWSNLTSQEPSPECYTFDLTLGPKHGWGPSFFFGGPGGDSCGVSRRRRPRP